MGDLDNFNSNFEETSTQELQFLPSEAGGMGKWLSNLAVLQGTLFQFPPQQLITAGSSKGF